MAEGFRVDGQKVDGFWMLSVRVTDPQAEQRMRVRGDMHVGGLMYKLVQELENQDWSDHALFWPERNQWLLRTKSTLDQYGVDAEATLVFTPMHKMLRVQLPDLRHLDLRVNFSAKCFDLVIDICKDLGIRHPEELSLCHRLTRAHLKANWQSYAAAAKAVDGAPTETSTLGRKKGDRNGAGHKDNNHHHHVRRANSSGSLLDSTSAWPPAASAHSRLGGSAGGLGGSLSRSLTLGSLDGLGSCGLSHSPMLPAAQAKQLMVHPRTLVEKARVNMAWLDSSLSIMEQGVKEDATLLLRFKFYNFYDLDPNYDAVRINMLYEQAKWQILNEEIDCTEEEMFLFAGLQLQVNLQGTAPRRHSTPRPAPTPPSASDDIASALDCLETQLEGTHVNGHGHGALTEVPELAGYLRFLRPKRLTLKGFKRYWFVFKDTSIFMYKSQQEAGTEPLLEVNLRGAEVTPNVNLSAEKFGIKLEVPAADGMSDIMLRCETEDQYARWVSACRLAAHGRSMADASFETEVSSARELLQLQRPSAAPAISPASLDIDPDDYVPPRFARKQRSKLTQRILEAHANVATLALLEAKLNYIRSWRAQKGVGLTYFIVRFTKAKREELLAVAPNQMTRMDLTGKPLKTWRYATMKAWNVNWQVRHMTVEFEEEKIVFSCLSCDCKVAHEFIGGYTFLQLRSKDSSQRLDHELFHKLTGGWH